LTPPSDGNGDSGVKHVALDTLVLTYDRTRDHLDVGGKCNSLDLMLDMLARATRTIEAQLRAQNALALQQQMRRAAEDQAVADALRNRR
jgi:predicted DNA-binding protein (UPF0278 family)